MWVLAKAPARDLRASQGVRGGCARAGLVGDEPLGTWGGLCSGAAEGTEQSQKTAGSGLTLSKA